MGGLPWDIDGHDSMLILYVKLPGLWEDDGDIDRIHDQLDMILGCVSRRAIPAIYQYLLFFYTAMHTKSCHQVVGVGLFPTCAGTLMCAEYVHKKTYIFNLLHIDRHMMHFFNTCILEPAMFHLPYLYLRNLVRTHMYDLNAN